MVDIVITQERALAYERPGLKHELTSEEVMAQAPDELTGGFIKRPKDKAWVEEEVTRYYELGDEGTIGDLLKTIFPLETF